MENALKKHCQVRISGSSSYVVKKFYLVLLHNPLVRFSPSQIERRATFHANIQWVWVPFELHHVKLAACVKPVAFSDNVTYSSRCFSYIPTFLASYIFSFRCRYVWQNELRGGFFVTKMSFKRSLAGRNGDQETSTRSVCTAYSGYKLAMEGQPAAISAN